MDAIIKQWVFFSLSSMTIFYTDLLAGKEIATDLAAPPRRVIDNSWRQFIGHLCNSSIDFALISYVRTPCVDDSVRIRRNYRTEIIVPDWRRADGLLPGWVSCFAWPPQICLSDTDRRTAGASNEVRGKVENGPDQSTCVSYGSTANGINATFCLALGRRVLYWLYMWVSRHVPDQAL